MTDVVSVTVIKSLNLSTSFLICEIGIIMLTQLEEVMRVLIS